MRGLRKNMNKSALFLLLVSLNAYSKPTCQDVLSKCDKAVEEQKKSIEILKKENDARDNLNKFYQKELEQAEKKAKNPIRQPIVLSGVAILGTVAVGPIVTGFLALLTHVILN